MLGAGLQGSLLGLQGHHREFPDSRDRCGDVLLLPWVFGGNGDRATAGAQGRSHPGVCRCRGSRFGGSPRAGRLGASGAMGRDTPHHRSLLCSHLRRCRKLAQRSRKPREPRAAAGRVHARALRRPRSRSIPADARKSAHDVAIHVELRADVARDRSDRRFRAADTGTRRAAQSSLPRSLSQLTARRGGCDRFGLRQCDHVLDGPGVRSFERSRTPQALLPSWQSAFSRVFSRNTPWGDCRIGPIDAT